VHEKSIFIALNAAYSVNNSQLQMKKIIFHPTSANLLGKQIKEEITRKSIFTKHLMTAHQFHSSPPLDI
jgi:hypothetical protein